MASKQKLSAKAKKDKAIRDLKIANTPRRKAMRAENQKKRRAAILAGKNIDGKEFDHTKGKFVSVKENRSQYGKGTRKGVKNGQGKKNK